MPFSVGIILAIWSVACQWIIVGNGLHFNEGQTLMVRMIQWGNFWACPFTIVLIIIVVKINCEKVMQDELHFLLKDVEAHCLRSDTNWFLNWFKNSHTFWLALLIFQINVTLLTYYPDGVFLIFVVFAENNQRTQTTRKGSCTTSNICSRN